MLREQGMRVTPQAVKEGLERAVWHARFEVLTADNIAQSPYDIVIPQGKTLVLDGAHNPQGAQALAETVAEYLPARRIAAVVGVLADKEYAKAMQAALPFASEVYTVTPDSPRALSAGALAECCKSVTDAPVSVCGGVREAVEEALAGECDTTVVFGSLTLFHELAKKDADA